MALVGGCVCGAVGYEILSEPLVVLACHCTDCQRSTGSAFVVNIGVPKADLRVEGELTTVTNPTPSGAGYDANYCSACATVIWSKYHFIEIPMVAVRGGTLDDPFAVQPTVHIFTVSKQPWVNLPDGALSFPGWLDPETALSERSRARMAAMAS